MFEDVKILKSIGATNEDILSNPGIICQTDYRTSFDFKVKLFEEKISADPTIPFPTHLFKKSVSRNDFALQLGVTDPLNKAALCDLRQEL